MTKGKIGHPNGYNVVYINSLSFLLITSPNSVETTDNGVTANIYAINSNSSENRQEMTSSL